MRAAASVVVTATLAAGMLGLGASAASAAAGPSGGSQGRPYPGSPASEAPLVQREDDRLLTIGSAIAKADFGSGAHTIDVDGKPNLVLGANDTPYTLQDLGWLLPTAFRKLSDGSYVLSRNIVIAPGATLDLHDDAPFVLHLASSRSHFVSIVDFGGELRLSGSKGKGAEVNAWDADAHRVDTDTTDGRAYVRVIGGSTRVSDVHFSDLGFWSGTTGGLSLTGTRSATTLGAVTKDTESSGGTASSALVTGTITRSTFDGDAYGLFVTGAKDVHLSDSVVRNSLVDGVVFHRYVTGSSVTRTRSVANAVDGFRLSRGSSGTTLTDVQAQANGYNGVTVDGSALADGPSATGLDTKVYGNSSVTGSTMTGNAHDGIQVLGGTAIRLRNDRVSGSPTGIVVAGAVKGVQVVGNRISGATAQGIAVRSGATGATLQGNHVSGSPVGIHVRDSVASVTGNRITGATSHGISVVGRAAGTTVTGNTLGGIGPSAVDVLRTSHVAVHRNAVRGWTTTQTLSAFLRSKFKPLTVVWLVLGVLVLLTAGGSLRHRRRGIRHPYPDHTPLAAIAGPAVDPVTLGLPRAPSEVTS